MMKVFPHSTDSTDFTDSTGFTDSHHGFFAPFIKALAGTTDIELFEKELVTFLESERVCERTDDDKSIILVTRNASL